MFYIIMFYIIMFYIINKDERTFFFERLNLFFSSSLQYHIASSKFLDFKKRFELIKVSRGKHLKLTIDI